MGSPGLTKNRLRFEEGYMRVEFAKIYKDIIDENYEYLGHSVHYIF
ncbi:hypothetical protein NBRC116598_42220 [Pseudophaeobacter arcticus]|uniref:Uncharacterized protein n=1 Tax=Pseudophaeobacter arcticus TaxID=385492 RepID=A0ABQ0ASD8_9RHOB